MKKFEKKYFSNQFVFVFFFCFLHEKTHKNLIQGCLALEILSRLPT